MAKRPWQDFKGVLSESFVKDLVPAAREVSPDELELMKDYRLGERKAACGGVDPIRILLAYAQDELAYDENGNAAVVSTEAYKKLSRESRVNKFGLSYRRDAGFWQNRILADIVVGAAIRLYQTQGWTTVLYDGLRTVDGAYNLYCFAPDKDIQDGLLALPGQSAHNKGLAIDSMMEKDGSEIDMGGHFDHLDMESNSRAYAGDKISAAAKKNRLIREAAFLRSAFSQGLLVAPLRSEFWDDRPPENREDLWRVLDSAARCLGIELLSAADIALHKKDREAFRQKWESWNYADFLARWQEVFKGQEKRLEEMFGTAMPPMEEKPEFYHGNFHPIYDERLKASGKNLTAT